jgi:acetyl esterase/lipase
MKKSDCLYYGVIVTLLALASPISAVAQHLRVQRNIPYCNAQYPGEDKMRRLCFDFYEPEGRADTLRPLVINMFGGGFVAGSRDYEDMVAWCNRFAEEGIAAASIDYRLMPARKFSAKSLIRTGYMAAQDVSAAVRFFKANADKYRIDTNRIFLLGQSAGAVAILHALYMDEDERPSETFLEPELPPLHSTGNAAAMKQTFSVAGAVLLWGCIFSPDMIDPDETTPVCLIHGGKDIILPPDSGYAFSIPGLPYAYGSQPIADRLKELGTAPFELHIFEDEPHVFYFKLLYMFNLDPLKHEKCFNIAWDFIRRHDGTEPE